MTDYSDQYSNGSSKIVATYSLIFNGPSFEPGKWFAPHCTSAEIMIILLFVLFTIFYFLCLIFLELLNFFPSLGSTALGP